MTGKPAAGLKAATVDALPFAQSHQDNHAPGVCRRGVIVLAGGSGFGLSIARRWAKDHGGFIRVASRPGAGTEFTVYPPLPAISVSTGAPAGPERDGEAKRPLQTPGR